jgi:hypothetical protein
MYREGATMDRETVIVAHLVRLLRQSPSVVWDLLPGQVGARPTDVPLRDPHGAIVAYARPTQAHGKGQ